MSALQIQISDQDREFVERLARANNADVAEAAATLMHEAIQSRKEWDSLQARARRGAANPKSLKDLLSQVPDAAPVPGDELP